MTSKSKQPISIDDVVQQLRDIGSVPNELQEVYSEEASEHLRTIYHGLQQLQADNSDDQALSSVRRASHTLKGAAGAVGLKAVTQLAHRMEDLLDHLAESNNPVSEDQLLLLLCTADQLDSLSSDGFDTQDTAKQIQSLYRQYDSELDHTSVSPRDSEIVNKGFDGAGDNTSDPLTDSQPLEISREPASNGSPKSSSSQHVRVPLDRIDRLVSLLDEMTVNRSEFQIRLNEFEARIDDMQNARDRLREAAMQVETNQTNNSFQVAVESKPHDFDALEFDQFSDSVLIEQSLAEADKDVEIMSGEFAKVQSAFHALLARQQRLIHGAHKALNSVRLVRLDGIKSKLERAVRNVSRKVNRDVSFRLEGGDIELDKTVLDAITDPLMHLIRNAVDHGIEEKEVRQSAGKPELAVLQIQAVNFGTQILIRVKDDGAGINVESVRQKALQQGLIEPSDELTNQELYTLIFRPGFSTAASLTDVSGRGVGMDVVGTAISKLDGSIRVNSKPGKGTTFSISLPTTMGMTRAVMVETCGKRFAVPMQSILQIAQFEPRDYSKGEEGDFVSFANEQLPLNCLGSYLQLGVKHEPFTRNCPMLLIDNGESTIAVTVDRVWSCQEVVVKPLGEHIRNIPGINGVTLDGSGTVVPILDTATLGCESEEDLLLLQSQDEFRAPRAKRRLAMVIDDSISVRRVTENLLKRSGWDVVTAKDGVDALESLSNLDHAPDVFLCDMEMPRMNGLELMRQVRDQKEFQQTPIVMVTSRASEKHRQKAFEAGATDYVVKPYDERQLLSLINELVEVAQETIPV